MIERQLIDAVVRHGLNRVDLEPDDFSDRFTRRAWRSLVAMWDIGATPTVELLAYLLVDAGEGPLNEVGATVMFLPLGRLALVDDIVAVIGCDSRRRRATVAFALAAEDVATGQNVDVVLARTIEAIS